MAILKEATSKSNQGFAKGLAAGAEHIMMDTLQKYQYAYPIPSTVREIACNAIDATKEKFIAIDILKGNAKVEDYYIQREGDLYKASNWNPEYYNLDFLNDKKEIIITYNNRESELKDQVIFSDNGVGLGDERLLGYFQLGFSTKRNSLKAIGKWGLGAKAPLSTNVNFYTMETRHNGRLFRFNIYSYKVDPLIPAIDLDSGKENPYITYTDEQGEEHKVHYLITSKSNGTDIIIDVPKHKKNEYWQSVRNQLMYFDNIYYKEAKDGVITTVSEVYTQVFFDNEHIILSDNKIYTRPHLVMNGVNYNDINFLELELSQKFGNIGIKVDASEVEITPSRESVIWSDVTREAVLLKLGYAQGIATEIINEELGSETDIILWLEKVRAISGRTKLKLDNDEDNTNNDEPDVESKNINKSLKILSRLGDLLDKQKLNIQFNNNPKLTIENTREFFRTHRVRFVEFRTQKNGKIVIKRSDATKFTYSVDFSKAYYKMERTSNKKDTYLLQNVHPDGFYVIEPDLTEDQLENLRFSDSQVEVYKAIKESKYLKKYADVRESNEAIDDFEEEAPETKLTPKEMRELSDSIVFKTIIAYNPEQVSTNQHDIPLGVLAQIKDPFIYGSLEDKELLAMYSLINGGFNWDKISDKYADDFSNCKEFLTREEKLGYSYNSIKIDNIAGVPTITSSGTSRVDPTYSISMYKNKTPIALVAKDKLAAISKIDKAIYAKSLLLTFEGTKIKINPVMKHWYTARLIDQYLSTLQFDEALIATLSSDKAKLYTELQAFADTRQGSLRGTQSFENEVCTYLDKLVDLQLTVHNQDDEHAVALKAKELFGDENITGAEAIDIPMYEKLQILKEYLEPVVELFNSLDQDSTRLPHSALIKELRFYAESKGMDISN